MKCHALIVVALVACQSKGDDNQAAKPGSATDPWSKPAAGSADDPPTLAERTAFANEACPTVAKPWFFAVEKDGRTSHILGTRHIGVGLDKFPQVVRDDFDASTLAIFEIAPAEMVKVDLPKEPLRDELGPADWAHLEALVGTAMAKRLVHAAPVSAALGIGVLYEDLSVALDKQLQQRAADHHIATNGLETVKLQIDLLTKWLDVRLLKTIVETTPDRAKIKKLSHDALVRYCAGTDHQVDIMEGIDTEALARHGYTKQDLEELQHSLIDDRNADWIPKLEKLFEQDNVFVAVGAAHLQGPKGVIELLKQRGYEITRIAK
jgi:uncharacterized protein YbaP (TraB family)